MSSETFHVCIDSCGFFFLISSHIFLLYLLIYSRSGNMVIIQTFYHLFAFSAIIFIFFRENKKKKWNSHCYSDRNVMFLYIIHVSLYIYMKILIIFIISNNFQVKTTVSKWSFMIQKYARAFFWLVALMKFSLQR